MKLIVGLGNPGKEYENTRHNCGFRAIDYYAEKNNMTFKKKFNSLYCEQVINNEKVIFVKPLTFMNLSGNSVIEFVNFYKINIKDILIIYDDKDFEIGTFKIKRGGSSAGHNGIKNIISVLHSEDVSRIRIGISKNDNELMDYVLGNFSISDNKKLNEIFPIISNAIEDFTILSIDKLMEKYNRNKNGK